MEFTWSERFLGFGVLSNILKEPYSLRQNASVQLNSSCNVLFNCEKKVLIFIDFKWKIAPRSHKLTMKGHVNVCANVVVKINVTALFWKHSFWEVFILYK